MAAEPYYVPGRSFWIGDVDDSVVIVGKSGAGALPLSLLRKGSGFVATRWRKCICRRGVFFVQPRPDPISGIPGLGGDSNTPPSVWSGIGCGGVLNAKSMKWDSPVTDARGQELAEWGTELGLIVLNRDPAHTCV